MVHPINMTDNGFHVYFWRLLIFRLILYKGDISIKRTLLSCTNNVHLIEIPLWLLKRHVEFSQRHYSTNYEFLFSKFLKHRNWGGEGEFYPKRTYLEGRDREGGVLENEKEQARGEGEVKTRESWANVLFDCPLMEFNLFHFSCTKKKLVIRNPRVNYTGLKGLFSRICKDMIDKSGDVAWYTCRTS